MKSHLIHFVRPHFSKHEKEKDNKRVWKEFKENLR